jgi:hypothetical protein
MWAPAKCDFGLEKKAKAEAKKATKVDRTPNTLLQQSKSTVVNIMIAKQREKKSLPKGVGEYTRQIDIALPGKHTRTLYDSLNRREAKVLAQLRTGMIRLNGYLHQIGAAESDQCRCGKARETVKHFLFRCSQWDAQRTQLLQRTNEKSGNLSFCVGGKAASDGAEWAPNMEVVRTAIQFVISTGRLEMDIDE